MAQIRRRLDTNFLAGLALFSLTVACLCPLAGCSSGPDDAGIPQNPTASPIPSITHTAWSDAGNLAATRDSNLSGGPLWVRQADGRVDSVGRDVDDIYGWSHDGRSIAYEDDSDEKDMQPALHIYRVDTHTDYRLTDPNTERVFAACWVGNDIAFSKTTSAGLLPPPQVVFATPAGHVLRQISLPTLAGVDGLAAATPSGEVIALDGVTFPANRMTDRVYLLSGTALAPVPGTEGLQELAAGPAGGPFYAADIDPTTGTFTQLQRVTFGPQQAATAATLFTAAALPGVDSVDVSASPDGQYLLVNAQFGLNQSRNLIYLYHVATGRMDRVAAGDHAAFMPGGGRISFVADATLTTRSDVIRTCALDGSDVRTLAVVVQRGPPWPAYVLVLALLLAALALWSRRRARKGGSVRNAKRADNARRV